jgi:hypothetical protein
MQFEASTSTMTSAAGGLSRAAEQAQGLASAVHDQGAAVSAAIHEGGVAAAASRAVGAVSAQVEVAAGGIEYAATGLGDSAATYDRVDTAASERLAGLTRAR